VKKFELLNSKLQKSLYFKKYYHIILTYTIMSNYQRHSQSFDRFASPIRQSDTLKTSNTETDHQSSQHSSKHKQGAEYDTATRAQQPSTTSTSTNEREVDYYENPTELFRWINYRKWGGAWARVESNPEECATWVVSRHSSDGRILWRSLPLHLVCMQSGGVIDTENSNNIMGKDSRDASDSTHPARSSQSQQRSLYFQQLEKLTEAILFAYPDAAKAIDDQGMLPLHLCINNASESNCINERIMLLLLVAYPAGLGIRDNRGRTPMDLALEKRSTAPGIVSAIRIMEQAELMVQSVSESIHEATREEIRTLVHRSENERRASQRIISRLEDELADEQRKSESQNNTTGEMRMKSSALQEELQLLKRKYDSLELDLDQVRKERDELISTNRTLTERYDRQEEIIADIRRQAENECSDQKNTISILKSEANAARSMVDAVENQLRTKFTNEQDLKGAVDKLENKVAVLTSEYQKEKKILQNEVERLKVEHSLAEKTVQELTTKSKEQQVRNNELTKHMENILFSHSALAGEYDKLLDSSKRYESRVLENIQMERDGLFSAIEKQRKMYEAAIEEQRVMMDEAKKKETEFTDLIAQERRGQLQSVMKIKDDYQTIRCYVSSQPVQRTAPTPGLLNGPNKEMNFTKQGPSLNKENQQNDRQQLDTSAVRNFSEVKDNDHMLRSRDYHVSQIPGYLQMLEKRSQNQHNNPALSPSSSSFANLSIRSSSSMSSTIKQKDMMAPKSFSLDEFSDFESRPSSSNHSIINDYGGMTSAIKRGMIRVNSSRIPDEVGRKKKLNQNNVTIDRNYFDDGISQEPISMEAIRQRYSRSRNNYQGDNFSLASSSDIMPFDDS
jgi:hypothetical protein